MSPTRQVIRRFLIWFVICCILLFIGASVYVKIYGKALLEKTLAGAVKRDVALGAVSYQFPLGFKFENVHISGPSAGKEFLSVKEINARLSFGAISQRRLIFDDVMLLEPSALIEQVQISQEVASQARRYGVIVTPGLQAGDNQAVQPQEQTLKKEAKISISRLIVKGGRLRYIGALTEKRLSFRFEDVYMKIQPLAFPLEPGRSEFDFSGRLVKEGSPLSGGLAKGRGWVDIVKRDMEAKIEMVEADGSVGLIAVAISKNNDMEVGGEVKIQNLLRELKGQADPDVSTINDMVLNALSSAGVEIGAKFSFKTKMDDFRIEQVSFSGNVVTK